MTEVTTTLESHVITSTGKITTSCDESIQKITTVVSTQSVVTLSGLISQASVAVVSQVGSILIKAITSLTNLITSIVGVGSSGKNAMQIALQLLQSDTNNRLKCLQVNVVLAVIYKLTNLLIAHKLSPSHALSLQDVIVYVQSVIQYNLNLLVGVIGVSNDLTNVIKSGINIAPLLTEVISFVQDVRSELANQFSQLLSINFLKVADVAKILAGIINLLTKINSTISQALKSIISSNQSTLYAVIELIPSACGIIPGQFQLIVTSFLNKVVKIIASIKGHHKEGCHLASSILRLILKVVDMVLTPLINSLNIILGNIFQTKIDSVLSPAETQHFIAKCKSHLNSALNSNLNVVIQFLSSLLNFISQVVVPVVNPVLVSAKVSEVVNSILTSIKNPIVTHVSQILQKLPESDYSVKLVVVLGSSIFDHINKLIQQIIDVLKKVLTTLQSNINADLNSIDLVITSACNDLSGDLKITMIQSLNLLANLVVKIYGPVGKLSVNYFMSIISTLHNGIEKILQSLIQNVLGLITSLEKSLCEDIDSINNVLVKQKLQILINNIASAGSDLTSNILDILRSKDYLSQLGGLVINIDSPLNILESLIKAIVDMVQGQVKSLLGQLTNQIKALPSDEIEFSVAFAIIKNVHTILSKPLKNIVDTLTNVLDTIINSITTSVPSSALIGSIVAKLPTKIAGLLQNAISLIVSQIQDRSVQSGLQAIENCRTALVIVKKYILNSLYPINTTIYTKDLTIVQNIFVQYSSGKLTKGGLLGLVGGLLNEVVQLLNDILGGVGNVVGNLLGSVGDVGASHGGLLGGLLGGVGGLLGGLLGEVGSLLGGLLG